MSFTSTDIPGLLIYEPRIFSDSRGYFFESYNEQSFIKAGVTMRFVQDNQSSSVYGVIRGLHYQLDPHAQTKLVRALVGSIWDVAVDLRKGSPTFGKSFGLELSAENKKQLLVPQGFAHGFSVLSEHAEVSYKCDAFYHKESERGIRFDDASLGIDWHLSPDKAIVSEKDLVLPSFKECDTNFVFEG